MKSAFLSVCAAVLFAAAGSARAGDSVGAAPALTKPSPAPAQAARAPEAEPTDEEWDRYLIRAKGLARSEIDENLDEGDLMKVLETAGLFLPPGAVAKRLTRFSPKVYEGQWRWPVRLGRVSSEFGPRWGKEHQGLDLAADPGVPVYAAAAGEVLYADNKLRGFGNVVILQHDLKTTTIYAHNTELFVKKGERVEMGRQIATLGSTGKSTGPHVHFEIRGSKGSVDPRKILPKSRF